MGADTTDRRGGAGQDGHGRRRRDGRRKRRGGDPAVERRGGSLVREHVAEAGALEEADERGQAVGVAGMQPGEVDLAIEIGDVQILADVAEQAMRDREVPGQLERARVVGKHGRRRAREQGGDRAVDAGSEDVVEPAQVIDPRPRVE